MSEKVCPKCGSKNIENRPYNPDDHGLNWIDYWICKDCGKTGFKPADAPYNQLEDIVPPLEICKRIQTGLFQKTALVWASVWVGRTPFVGTREKVEKNEQYTICPAPTMAEIMAELTSNGLDVPAVKFDGVKWTAFYSYHNSGNPMCPCENANPATAALKLWMELNTDETDTTDGKGVKE